MARISEELNVTQPAVSKQISELERIVGTPIVTRDKNRLYLTKGGRSLAAHAKKILNQLDRAAFDLEAMAAGVSGTVSIGVVSSVAPTLLPGAISMFKRSTPKASVSINEGHFVELFPQLEAGSLDLLIARIWQPSELPNIEQMALFSEPVIVVGGPDHPLARKQDLVWSDTADMPWILPKANSIARGAMDTLFAENGLLPPENTISSMSLALNMAILKKMQALAFLPQGLAQSYAASGALVALPLDTMGLLSEARCFWRRDGLEKNGTLGLFLRCLEQTTEDMQNHSI